MFTLNSQHHILAVFELHDVRKLPIFLGIGDLLNTFALDARCSRSFTFGTGQPKSPLTTVTGWA